MEFNPLDKESVIERANGGELFRYKIAFLPDLFLTFKIVTMVSLSTSSFH